MGAESENFKDGVEVARRIVTHPLCESRWNRGHFSVKKWESEKHKSWDILAKGVVGPCYHGRLFARKSGQVGSMWLGSGFSWIMMRRWSRCTGCMARWKI